MTIDEALDLVVGHTKHERYRWLCGDDNPDVESRDAYRAIVMRMAGDEPLSPQSPSLSPELTPVTTPSLPLAESLRLTALVRKCPYRSRPACGCAEAHCGIARANRNQQECLRCVGTYGV